MVKWGNLIEAEDMARKTTFYQTEFKRFLDPEFLRYTQDHWRHDKRAHVPDTDAAVDKLFQDYLSKVQSHLAQQWRNKRVDFIFSVPTTWNDKPNVVQRFKTLFREAGFGEKGDLKHRAFIGDTEAVAAGVYALLTLNPQEYSVRFLQLGVVIHLC